MTTSFASVRDRSDSLDVDALRGALRVRPPLTLLAYADRLLLACVVDPLDEKAALLARAGSVVDHAKILMDGGAIFGDLTTLLVITALYLEEGVPEGEQLRVALAPFALASRPHVVQRPEPERSVHFYWQQRAQLGKAVAAGPDPDDALVALYHHAHAVFFASRYGAGPMERPTGVDALARAHAALGRIAEPNADCLAEILLANECVRPVDVALRGEVVQALATLQDSDGTLGMPNDADADARHHALVVAALALALAGDD
jgi:hypothetical protein